jgi:PAP2 superfamily.
VTRGIGETGVVEAIPEVVVALFGVATHLADPWFVFGSVGVIYLLAGDRIVDRPRHAGAVLISLAVCGLAATLLAKVLVAVPRPPAAAVPAPPPAVFPGIVDVWFRTVTTASGFGFPSGHAVAATVLYGGIAHILDRPARSLRWGLAVAVIGIVSLSRVIIQVHYVVDVVAGVVVGATVLWGVLQTGDRRTAPDPALGLALGMGLAVAAVGVAAFNGFETEVGEALITLSVAGGGSIGWRLCDGDESALAPAAAIGTLAVGGGIVGVTYLVGGGGTVVAAAGLVTAWVVGAPSILDTGVAGKFKTF